MLVTTRLAPSRPTTTPTQLLPPRRPPHVPENVAVLGAALLRAHADASALLGIADPDAYREMAPIARTLSREARDVADSLTGGPVAAVAPPDAPGVVLVRDMAAAQRILARALGTPPAAAHCAMLMTSLARVTELRDRIDVALERRRGT